MNTFRPKLWTSLSAAALLSATGLAACSGEGGEAAAPAASPGSVASVGGEGEGGEAAGGTTAPGATDLAGEAGEAGAQGAYDTVPADSRRALRLAHLRGFVLAAQAAAPAEGLEAAAALVGQGLLEVYDPAKAEFAAAGVDEATLRRAAQSGAPADLMAALGTLDAASAKAGGDPAQVVKGMTNIASGLYGEVLKDGAVDTVEYQHSLGAALSAQAAARTGNVAGASGELAKFVALWPGPVAPADVARITPSGQVLAQASRVELALSR
jgi:hypothetical protein